MIASGELVDAQTMLGLFLAGRAPRRVGRRRRATVPAAVTPIAIDVSEGAPC